MKTLVAWLICIPMMAVAVIAAAVFWIVFWPTEKLMKWCER